MKLSPLFAIALLVSIPPAMAESGQGPAIPPSLDADTADSNRVELAISDVDDLADDLCWVAPEWREISR